MKVKDIQNLEDCIKYMIIFLGIDDLEKWCRKEESESYIQLHHNLGQYIRNELSLWENNNSLKSNFVKWFNKNGIYHADDMSSIIFISLHRYLNKKDILLKDQIKKYIEYWDKVDPKVNKGIFN